EKESLIVTDITNYFPISSKAMFCEITHKLAQFRFSVFSFPLLFMRDSCKKNAV
ncbi:hypothetical protein AAUPMC_15010, partial [Pasteurella multocida subsp. multocida str. Anand1_cattle]